MSDFPDHSDIAGRQTLDAGLTTLTQLPSWKCPPSSSFSLPQRFFIDLTLALMKDQEEGYGTQGVFEPEQLWAITLSIWFTSSQTIDQLVVKQSRVT